MMKIKFEHIIILLGIFLFAAASYFTKPEPNPIYSHTQSIDTLFKYDTVNLLNTRIVYVPKIKWDTVEIPILSYPFVAVLDTIDYNTKDTLHIEYSFPVNTLLYQVNRKPWIQETKYIRTFDTIRIPMEYTKELWYVPIAKYTACFVIGYAVGSIK